MNEVQWIGGGPVTKEQIDFFLGPATHDMIEEELQLNIKYHKIFRRYLSSRIEPISSIVKLKWKTANQRLCHLLIILHQ